MPKPWARYQVGFIDHAKFRALNANAIVLWIEGKNYCDEHHTDGLMPTHIVKQFRFYSKKAVALLTTSCGFKNETEQFAPLWDQHVVGFKMHDYLDHNDCREEVLARLDDAADMAELRKVANRERQAKFREERRAKLAAHRDRDRNAPRNAPRNGSVTPLSHPPTEAVSETPTVPSTTPNGVVRPAPALRRRRLDAAWEHESGLYVPQRAHDDLVALHPRGFEPELFPWYEAVCASWVGRNTGADMIRFWKARHDETWPPERPAAAKRGPTWAV